MNHGWPNVGHDALVMAVRTAACDLADALVGAGLRVRAVSCDVRRGLVLPPPPDRRGGVYVGTGGPGHLDPAHNDGGAGSQGIVEDRRRGSRRCSRSSTPSTPQPGRGAHRRLPHLRRDVPLAGRRRCRSCAAPEKGGKSAGIIDNVLTPAAAAHPWFGGLATSHRPDGGRIRILDSRLYDLLPRPRCPPDRHAARLRDARARRPGRRRGDDVGGGARRAPARMPRVFGVNHHPEIVDRARALRSSGRSAARGEVSHEWYRERAEAMTETLRDDAADRGLDADLALHACSARCGITWTRQTARCALGSRRPRAHRAGLATQPAERHGLRCRRVRP